MHILIATDKFKGSLSAADAAGAMQAGARRVFPDAVITIVALSDGGEGFCAAVHRYAGTETIRVPVTDPLGRPLIAAYEWDAVQKTAWVELCAASGLSLLKPDEYHPLKTSTAGTGLLIRDALLRGAENVHLGLGGSATCDAGMGLLSALGLQFFDCRGKLLAPCGENLIQIQSIQGAEALPSLEWELAADVLNPLFGPDGAAALFAPQKGADPAAVRLLDEGLRHFARCILNWQGRSVDQIPGAGAAGGVAAGLSGWYTPVIRSGANWIMDIAGLPQMMREAQLVITGEGSLDRQTSQGKLLRQLAALAQKHNVPVIACCGRLDITPEALRKMGIDGAGSLDDMGVFLNAGAMEKLAALKELTEQCIRKIFPG